YDGTSWTTLTSDVGLPSMSVPGLATDPRDGSIWAACLPGAGVEGGLVHIENGFPVVHRGLTLDATGNEDVYSVLVTRAGRVWLGYAGGLAEWTGAGFREFASGGPTVVQTLTEGANGELWFGTGNRGFGRFDDDALAIFPSGPPSNDIRATYADPAGVLWVG